jgi:maleate isomerase
MEGLESVATSMSRKSKPIQRIGLLIPSTNTVMEQDFRNHLPNGWMLAVCRMSLTEVTPAGEARMLDECVLPATRLLVSFHPGVVVFGCTSAGVLRGALYEKELLMQISQSVGAPTLSVMDAVKDAMQREGVKRLVVATPYIEALNEPIRASLETEGFRVLRIVGLGIAENGRIAAVSRSQIFKLAKECVGGLSPDALFFSCTNFPVWEMVEELVKMFSIRVITSNQAAFCQALRTAAGAML